MKNRFTGPSLAVAATALLWAGTPVAAQVAPVPPTDDSVAVYWRHHRELYRELVANPSLVTNSTFLSQHRGLADFEATHPDWVQQFQAQYGSNPTVGSYATGSVTSGYAYGAYGGGYNYYYGYGAARASLTTNMYLGTPLAGAPSAGVTPYGTLSNQPAFSTTPTTTGLPGPQGNLSSSPPFSTTPTTTGLPGPQGNLPTAPAFSTTPTTTGLPQGPQGNLPSTPAFSTTPTTTGLPGPQGNPATTPAFSTAPTFTGLPGPQGGPTSPIVNPTSTTTVAQPSLTGTTPGSTQPVEPSTSSPGQPVAPASGSAVTESPSQGSALQRYLLAHPLNQRRPVSSPTLRHAARGVAPLSQKPSSRTKPTPPNKKKGKKSATPPPQTNP